MRKGGNHYFRHYHRSPQFVLHLHCVGKAEEKPPPSLCHVVLFFWILRRATGEQPRRFPTEGRTFLQNFFFLMPLLSDTNDNKHSTYTDQNAHGNNANNHGGIVLSP